MNATGIAPPATMSGLVRVNDDVVWETTVELVTVDATVVGVVPTGDVVDAITAAVELGTTEVVDTESLFVCAEQPAVTRIIQVSEVVIRRFMK